MRARTVLLVSAAVAATAVAVAAAGCAQRVDERPHIEILTPTNGNSTGASTFPVRVNIRNFQLTLTTEGGNVPFLGHWELFLGDQAQGFVSLGRQFTTSATISAAAGTYVIDAELENIDDEPVLGAPPSYVVVTVPTTPSVNITSPAGGAVIPSSSVDLAISVENFTLSSSATVTPGQGHYHVYAGAGLGGPLLLSDYRPTATVTRLDEAFPGASEEILTVALVNGDDTPVAPTTAATITLQRPPGSPGIHLVDPTDGAHVASTFPIAVTTTNFTLVDWTGAVADSAGQGHYQILVDGTVVSRAFNATTSATISAGSHEVRVQLVGNLDDPLSPPVVDFARVTSP